MTIELGPVTVDRISELDHWRFPATDMFPQVTPALYGCDTVDLSITTHLVRTPDGTVLVDAGNGNDKHRPVLTAHAGFRTDYLDRLAAIVPLDRIDVVVCTHLHPDHCGGLTRRDGDRWVPAFPNARHLVSRADLEWLRGVHASEPDGGVPADLARTWADSVAPVLDAGLLEAVDLPTEVADGVVLRSLPGHTAGHLVAAITTGGTAVISGDVLHHPLQFGDPGLAQSGDADPDAAARSRRALCAELAASGGLLLPAHFEPVRIGVHDGGYRALPDGRAS